MAAKVVSIQTPVANPEVSCRTIPLAFVHQLVEAAEAQQDASGLRCGVAAHEREEERAAIEAVGAVGRTVAIAVSSLGRAIDDAPSFPPKALIASATASCCRPRALLYRDEWRRWARIRVSGGVFSGSSAAAEMREAPSFGETRSNCVDPAANRSRGVRRLGALIFWRRRASAPGAAGLTRSNTTRESKADVAAIEVIRPSRSTGSEPMVAMRMSPPRCPARAVS